MATHTRALPGRPQGRLVPLARRQLLNEPLKLEVMRRLREIAKARGQSVLVVSHDDRIREFVDRVLWLEDGESKANGRSSATRCAAWKWPPNTLPHTRPLTAATTGSARKDAATSS
jgi:ABC-type glutathione transport system ATPase component